ncbi:MAG: hypothetical protein GY909_01145 [Oligoflexia bacterium]|nr:hypothetical protein [Oligoflexia bacterium]
MELRIEKYKLNYLNEETLGFMVGPESPSSATNVAIFTHGFTSHKGSILNWAIRLAEEGMACFIFDQPGHYLGNFSEVHDFEEYKIEVPKLFHQSYELVKSYYQLNEDHKLIYGGHSLGALMAIKASEIEIDKEVERIIAVGFGLPPEGVTHIFNTKFYKSTLKVRAQLVSKAISPEVVFPWIKAEKVALATEGQHVHLISGEDDMVVGKEGTEGLKKILETRNTVTIEKPTKLPHHLPEMAAPHIKKYLKDEGLLTN